MTSERQKQLVSRIGGLPIFEGGHLTDDNILSALATYFERRPDCSEDIDDETGWSKWAKANLVLNRIVNCLMEEIQNEST